VRKRWLRGRTVRYTGPVKVIETTGQWGVYAGERIVLGEGRSLEDDLGLKIRKAFQPGAAQALSSGQPLAEITIKLRRR
jgi:hypothetical protein